MMSHNVLSLAAILSLLLSGCIDQPSEETLDDELADESDGDAQEDVSSLAGGSPDAAHPAVGLLVVNRPGGGNLCSGTLITPSTVLTAAHCIHPAAPPGGEPTAIQVRFGPSAYQAPEESRNASSWARHPDWTGAVNPVGDLAVVHLASPSSRTPIPYLSDNAAAAGYAYQTATLVGYGLPTVGSRVAGQTLVTGYDGVAFSASGVGAHICSGDSGGPMLIGGVIIGVASTLRSFGGCNGVTIETWHTDTSRYAAWIAANTI
jgi:secreted trypsin-like serine protease